MISEDILYSFNANRLFSPSYRFHETSQLPHFMKLIIFILNKISNEIAKSSELPKKVKSKALTSAIFVSLFLSYFPLSLNQHTNTHSLLLSCFVVIWKDYIEEEDKNNNIWYDSSIHDHSSNTNHMLSFHIWISTKWNFFHAPN